VSKRSRVTKEKLKEIKHEKKNNASNKVIVSAVYYWVPLTANKQNKQKQQQLSEMKPYRIFGFKAGTY